MTSQDEAEHEVRVPGTAPNAKVGGRFRQLAAKTAAAERGHDTENLQGFMKYFFTLIICFFTGTEFLKVFNLVVITMF